MTTQSACPPVTGHHISYPTLPPQPAGRKRFPSPSAEGFVRRRPSLSTRQPHQPHQPHYHNSKAPPRHPDAVLPTRDVGDWGLVPPRGPISFLREPDRRYSMGVASPRHHDQAKVEGPSSEPGTMLPDDHGAFLRLANNLQCLDTSPSKRIDSLIDGSHPVMQARCPNVPGCSESTVTRRRSTRMPDVLDRTPNAPAPIELEEEWPLQGGAFGVHQSRLGCLDEEFVTRSNAIDQQLGTTTLWSLEVQSSGSEANQQTPKFISPKRVDDLRSLLQQQASPHADVAGSRRRCHSSPPMLDFGDGLKLGSEVPRRARHAEPPELMSGFVGHRRDNYRILRRERVLSCSSETCNTWPDYPPDAENDEIYAEGGGNHIDRHGVSHSRRWYYHNTLPKDYRWPPQHFTKR